LVDESIALLAQLDLVATPQGVVEFRPVRGAAAVVS
jgi:hypothetical protein